MAIYKATKLVTHALIIGLLIVIIVMLTRPSRSGFIASPLLTQPTGAAAQPGAPQSLFDIKPSLECTPGPSENASYYTMGLTPGGLCDDSGFVKGQLRDYSIVDGIGGSLLEKS